MKLRSKLTAILILIKLCLVQHSYAQDLEKIDFKVDSVFTLYYDFLKSSNSCAIDSTNFELVAKNLEKQQVIFDFFENISGLYLKREYRKEHEYTKDGISSYCYSTNNGFTKICVVYTTSDFEKWDQWYKTNKSKLCWAIDNRFISPARSMNFSYIDYKSFYPNFIRFKDRLDWIPISNKPGYVIDLEKKMEREGLIKSKSGIEKK
jgi:hypothetical protein